MLIGAFEIFRVERTEHRVGCNSGVEAVDQRLEERLTTNPFVHRRGHPSDRRRRVARTTRCCGQAIRLCLHSSGRSGGPDTSCGRSSMAEPQPSKLMMRVRSSSAALLIIPRGWPFLGRFLVGTTPLKLLTVPQGATLNGSRTAVVAVRWRYRHVDDSQLGPTGRELCSQGKIAQRLGD